MPERQVEPLSDPRERHASDSASERHGADASTPRGAVSDSNVNPGRPLPTREIPAGLGPADGEHYREMARKLREIGREARLTGARREILTLATSYEGRAAHFDRHAALKNRGHGDAEETPGGSGPLS